MTLSPLFITKKHHETRVHVVLLMAMEKGQTGVICLEQDGDVFAGLNKNSVLPDSAFEFKCVAMQMNGMILNAVILEQESIASALC